MKNKIEHIKAFIRKHKTLFIVLAIIKLLLKVGLVIFFISKANGANAQSSNKLLREGNKFYNNEKYNNATESYSKALQKAPKDIRGHFNQGDALYKLNELDKAKELFTSISKNAANTDIKARAHYNIGNIWYKQEKWEESARAYKESLKLNPKDEDAKYNLMMALSKIKKNGGGGGGKDNKKDNQDQKQDKQQQDKNKNGNNQQPQNQQGQNKEQEQKQQQGQLSNEDAQKLLDAIGAEEGKVQQKLTKEKGEPKKVKVQKDW